MDPLQHHEDATRENLGKAGWMEQLDAELDARPVRTDPEVEEAERQGERLSHPPSLPPAVVEALSGIAAGVATGALAGGPPGAVIGAIVGGAVGIAAGVTLDADEQQRRAHDAQLDRDMGVTEGNIGEAAPDQPPAVRGTFSAASLGVGTGGGEFADGPIQDISS